MTEEVVNIEIDGRSLEARRGQMVIQVADAAGITIPRFCYHEKLSVAANCRMCLVEVEKSPKPMPACATPVMPGMKVYTRSKRALAAQKSAMEFLLINHPLDCPICDQGGECELQDVAMGYGGDVSRFTERKRSVADKDIGPLVATEMTRCIHCTRCIRFGEEIAGLRELGATGRGEHMEIGTYVERAMVSELSGNVIDLCPVGALTAKPSRYRARAWEMVQHFGVAPHDSVGSNIAIHTIRNEVIRVVPQENEEINETWISDRDRFSYLGLMAADRALTPLLRHDGELREVEWEQALNATVTALRAVMDAHGPDSVGVLVSPTATVEEMFLSQKLARGLGIASIDHRLRQGDFSDQAAAPVFPWLGQSIAELEKLDAAFLIGSNVRMEQPLIGHRIRKAALKGALVNFLNARRFDFRFPVAGELIVAPDAMVFELAALAVAVADIKGIAVPEKFAAVAERAVVDDTHKALGNALIRGERSTVLLGNQAIAHQALASLRMLAGWIAEHTGSSFGYLPEASNSVGGWLTGCVPHRLPGGVAGERSAGSVADMLAPPYRAYVLVGVEPELDCWNQAAAAAAMQGAELVVALSPYAGEALRSYATIVLPTAAFAESAGTYVNAEGRWQSVRGAVKPPGEARPAWKVLRVLGNLCALDGFEQESADAVTEEVFALCRDVEPDNRVALERDLPSGSRDGHTVRFGGVPLYAVDATVRRAKALQETPLVEPLAVRLNPDTIERLGLKGQDRAAIKQQTSEAILPIVSDEAIPEGCAWIPCGVPGSEVLGAAHGKIEISGA